MENKEIELFERQVLKSLNRVGLSKCWDIFFRSPLSLKEKDAQASVEYDVPAYQATFEYNAEYKEAKIKPEDAGKHEVAHLILAEIEDLATDRFTSETEIDKAVEKAANIIQKLL